METSYETAEQAAMLQEWTNWIAREARKLRARRAFSLSNVKIVRNV